jgi:hypothetical protein
MARPSRNIKQKKQGERERKKKGFAHLFFAPRMSQAFKDHIWTQLGLSYTVKQIYDKHKAIWWARINAGEAMTRDDFIRQ